MAISRVNEFAAEMLRRIERVREAAKPHTNNEVGQDAGNLEMVSGGGLKKSRDGLRKEAIVNDFLLNFAARVTLYVYEQTLVKRERDDVSASELDIDGLYDVAKDDRLVTEETLQADIQTLREYFDVFKNTNGLPNYSPASMLTLVFSELAKLICETLNASALASKVPVKYLHYYELLFPDFSYKKFTSAAGPLGVYAPHEFFWGSNGRPIPVLACLDDTSESGASGDAQGGGEQDPLYDEAVKIVTESRRASISLVQRRLRIGYNRAARMMEEMEAAGVVSSMDNSGTREVLVAGHALD